MFKNLLIILFMLRLALSNDIYDREKYFTNIHTLKLEGNTTFSYYYTTLYIGTPPQKQTVIIGTGSPELSFPCDSCVNYNCGFHFNKPFNRTASSTYEELQCGENFYDYQCSCGSNETQCKWEINYSEGSQLSGYQVKDYVILGDVVEKYYSQNYQNIDQNFVKFLNHERVKIPFGCTTKETIQFYQQEADGILGLSDEKNQKYLPSISDIYYNEHKNNNEQFSFSLCLSNKNGGYMSIGGYNKALHKPGAITNIVPYKGKHYSIKINGIKINEIEMITNVKYQQYSSIDSGTTLLFAPKSVIKAINKQIYAHCNQSEDNCLGNKEVESGQTCWRRNKKTTSRKDFFTSFPNIIFNLETFDFIWKPQNYLFIDPLRRNNKELYCFSFEQNYDDDIIIGGAWMRGYDILFDRAQKQLHFTQSSCNPDDVEQNYIEENTENVKLTKSDIELYEQLKQQLGIEDKQQQQNIQNQQDINNSNEQQKQNDFTPNSQENKNEQSIKKENQLGSNKQENQDEQYQQDNLNEQYKTEQQNQNQQENQIGIKNQQQQEEEEQDFQNSNNNIKNQQDKQQGDNVQQESQNDQAYQQEQQENQQKSTKYEENTKDFSQNFESNKNNNSTLPENENDAEVTANKIQKETVTEIEDKNYYLDTYSEEDSDNENEEEIEESEEDYQNRIQNKKYHRSRKQIVEKDENSKGSLIAIFVLIFICILAFILYKKWGRFVHKGKYQQQLNENNTSNRNYNNEMVAMDDNENL